MEATQASVNRRMDKEVGGTYIYNGILLSHKKEQNCAICRDMVVSKDCYTEWSKSEKSRYCILMHICEI